MKHIKSLVEFISFFIEDARRTDFFGLCAQMAFYLLLSVIPLLLFLLSVITPFIDQFQSYLFNILQNFLPDIAFSYLESILDYFLSNYSGSGNIVFLFFSFIFGAIAVRTITAGMRSDYGLKKQSLLKGYLYSLISTLLLAISIFFTLLVYIYSEYFITLINFHFQFDLGVLEKIDLYSKIFSIIITFIFLDFMYTMSTNVQLALKNGIPGAITATIGFHLFFQLLIVSINHSQRYTLLYGNLGGLFALLVGIYFICVILNFGGKINAYFCK